MDLDELERRFVEVIEEAVSEEKPSHYIARSLLALARPKPLPAEIGALCSRLREHDRSYTVDAADTIERLSARLDVAMKVVEAARVLQSEARWTLPENCPSDVRGGCIGNGNVLAGTLAEFDALAAQATEEGK